MHMLLAFLIGTVAGTLGAISGGGGLITIPSLIFMGLSPLSAIATTRLSVVGIGVGALPRYQRAGAIQWRFLPFAVMAAAIAGFIGPRLLGVVNEPELKRVTGVLLLIVLPVLFAKKTLYKKKRVISPERKLFGYVGLFFAMVYLSMFGAGGGILMIDVLVYFFGLTLTQANATGVVLGGLTVLVALVSYISHGEVSWALGIPLLLGSVVGGHMGARIALSKGLGWVRTIMVMVVVTSSLVLIFF